MSRSHNYIPTGMIQDVMLRIEPILITSSDNVFAYIEAARGYGASDDE